MISSSWLSTSIWGRTKCVKPSVSAHNVQIYQYNLPPLCPWSLLNENFSFKVVKLDSRVRATSLKNNKLADLKWEAVGPWWHIAASKKLDASQPQKWQAAGTDSCRPARPGPGQPQWPRLWLTQLSDNSALHNTQHSQARVASEEIR